MPTYVYKFVETGETIEIQQSFTDETLTEAVHPESGELMAVKKVFLPVGVTFKGDGFYKTDSRASTSKSKGASTASDASGSSESSASGSSESSASTGSGSSTTSDKPSAGSSGGSASDG